MTYKDQDPEAMLDQAIAEIKDEQIANHVIGEARERVWSQLVAQAPRDHITGCSDFQALIPAYKSGTLSASRRMLLDDHASECVICRKALHGTLDSLAGARKVVPITTKAPFWRRYAVAAGLLLTAGLSGWFVYDRFAPGPAGARAVVATASGSVYRLTGSTLQPVSAGTELGEREVLRTLSGRAMVKLSDGSTVEVGDRAELSVTAGRRDTTVHLDRGAIIVQAAKRRTGHLYVTASDTRIAVTGTVFSVNRGVKGSRVSVIEGEVHVEQGRKDSVLHSGDQYASHESVANVRIDQEIAWSQNFDQHVLLLRELARLKTKLETVQLPGLRYNSRLLDSMPSETVAFISVPNIGQALTDANRLFQDQLQQSPVLRQWWQSGNQNAAAGFDKAIAAIHKFSQYLGDEIVVVATRELDGGHAPVLAAEVHRPGLADVLRAELPKFAGSDNPSHGFQIIEGDAPILQRTRGELLIVLRNNRVIAGADVATVRAVAEGATGGLRTTDFGRAIEDTFRRGTGILIAADLKRIAAFELNRPSDPGSPALGELGFSDVRYLIAEQKQIANETQHSALITFAGTRQGVASWLAAPSAMGSLSFVSPDAQFAAAVVVKSPTEMLDLMLSVAGNRSSGVPSELAEVQLATGVDLRNDLVASLGGELTLAVDGPLLPVPSWKAIVEVTQPERLQQVLEKVVAGINAELRKEGKPEVRIESQIINGLRYYTIRPSDPLPLPLEISYTYSDGYLIAGASRDLVSSSIQNRKAGVTLSKSQRFLNLLPRDNHANVSGIVYQNAGELLGVLSTLLGPEAQAAAGEAGKSIGATLICAYGDSDRIEIATKGSPVNMVMQAMLAPGHIEGNSGRDEYVPVKYMPAVIELDNLEVRLGNRTILNSLKGSLTGRAIGLLGPNGAGKSTLINTLLGFHPPSSGTARIFGKDIRHHTRELRRLIGYMPESDSFVAGMSAVRFVRMMAELSGLPPDEALERAHESFYYVGLGEARYRNLGTYSLGMKQLAKLAQAIAHGPKLIFLDEPTNGLDPAARQRMIKLIREIRDTRDVYLIISSHLLRDVEECCEEVIILKDGRVAATCNLEEERRANLNFIELEIFGAEGAFSSGIDELGCDYAAGGHGRFKMVLREGVTVKDLYRVASERDVQIRKLNRRHDSLEDIFLKAMEEQGASNGRL